MGAAPTLPATGPASSCHLSSIHQNLTTDERHFVGRLKALKAAVDLVRCNSDELTSQLATLNDPASFASTVTKNASIEIADTAIRASMIVAGSALGFAIAGPPGALVMGFAGNFVGVGIVALIHQIKAISHKPLYPISRGCSAADIQQKAQIKRLPWLQQQKEEYLNRKFIIEMGASSATDLAIRQAFKGLATLITHVGPALNPIVGGLSPSDIIIKGKDGVQALANLRTKSRGAAGGALKKEKIEKLQNSQRQYPHFLRALRLEYDRIRQELRERLNSNRASSELSYRFITGKLPTIDDDFYNTTLDKATLLTEQLERMRAEREKSLLGSIPEE